MLAVGRNPCALIVLVCESCTHRNMLWGCFGEFISVEIATVTATIGEDYNHLSILNIIFSKGEVWVSISSLTHGIKIAMKTSTLSTCATTKECNNERVCAFFVEHPHKLYSGLRMWTEIHDVDVNDITYEHSSYIMVWTHKWRSHKMHGGLHGCYRGNWNVCETLELTQLHCMWWNSWIYISLIAGFHAYQHLMSL